MREILFITLILLAFGCSEWESGTDFKNALYDLNIEFSEEDSTLFLFTSVNECTPCKEELYYWNNKENNDFDLVLIVTERYKSNYESFIKNNDISIKSYLDQDNLFRKRELIPLVPYKVLMDEGQILKLGELGYNRLPETSL